MVTATKTTNPLPFEHLEPRRFEDLVRQLTYDFRKWQQLEATGRSGSDDGYDVRGWEIVGDPATDSDDAEDDSAERISGNSAANAETRRWLIQCKREKEIGPTKMKGYFDTISEDERSNLYGVIFAAACDFSKTTRDVLRDGCRKAGISECHIWGRGEIEDMLYQPKNDGLLFAYFGISLTIRRRSVRTELRARLTTKRKLRAALGTAQTLNTPVLFLDPEDETYPYKEGLPFAELNWTIRPVQSHHAWGIELLWKKCPAYLHENGIHWDIANKVNLATRHLRNPWM